MANAFAVQTAVNPAEAGLQLSYDVHITGTDVPGGYTAFVTYVSIAVDDSPGVINAKISTAIIQTAAAMGIVIVGRNMTLPAYTKG